MRRARPRLSRGVTTSRPRATRSPRPRPVGTGSRRRRTARSRERARAPRGARESAVRLRDAPSPRGATPRRSPGGRRIGQGPPGRRAARPQAPATRRRPLLHGRDPRDRRSVAAPPRHQSRRRRGEHRPLRRYGGRRRREVQARTQPANAPRPRGARVGVPVRPRVLGARSHSRRIHGRSARNGRRWLVPARPGGPIAWRRHPSFGDRARIPARRRGRIRGGAPHDGFARTIEATIPIFLHVRERVGGDTQRGDRTEPRPPWPPGTGIVRSQFTGRVFAQSFVFGASSWAGATRLDRAPLGPSEGSSPRRSTKPSPCGPTTAPCGPSRPRRRR